jgi:DNA polymerase III delta prime subunit
MRKAIKTLEKILEKGKITSANVISLIRPNHAKECLELAISGNLEDAIITLENDFKERNFDTDDMLRELYECIKQQPMEYRARLFYKLSETSRSCQVTSKPILPLIHMIGFISYAFLLPHFSNKCPMLGGDS